MAEEITIDECIKLIEQSIATDQYAEWATNGPLEIKLALINNGYALDILIHDPSSFIRGRVMLADPSYMKYRMHYKEDQSAINTALDEQVTADLEVIKLQIKYREEQGYDNPYMKVKYDALSRKPTLLEANMRRADLYLAGSPMWARDLAFVDVWSVCEEFSCITPTKEVAEEVFSELMDEYERTTIGIFRWT